VKKFKRSAKRLASEFLIEVKDDIKGALFWSCLEDKHYDETYTF